MLNGTSGAGLDDESFRGSDSGGKCRLDLTWPILHVLKQRWLSRWMADSTLTGERLISAEIEKSEIEVSKCFAFGTTRFFEKHKLLLRRSCAQLKDIAPILTFPRTRGKET